ncbi:sensor histidine kinase [Paenibacillus sp. YIM B09110]|uniref:sensor histidine kinase n=1 Tax=Paenibacillus sp. YIM B09110 TaxID=3126102 RepID=UPI00301B8F80
MHKLIIYYFVLVVLTITITGFTFKEINSRILFSKVAEMSEQSNTIIRENVLLTMDTVNNFSKMLLSNELLQENLPLGSEVKLSDSRKINLYLLEFLDSAPLFSSIYIFDLEGNRYSSDTQRAQAQLSLSLNDVKGSGLFDRALRLNGSPVISVNVDQLLKPRSDGNLVSYVRIINSTDTMQPIGLLIVNIPGNDIQPSYERVGNTTSSFVEILDKEGKLLSTAGEQYPVLEERVRPDYLSEHRTEGSSLLKHENVNYMVSSTKINKYDWVILSITPFSEMAKENDYFTMILLALLIINFLFLLGGSFVISRIITVPIGSLVRSMRKINTGHLVPVQFKTGSYEMTVLRDGYNLMVERIESLISRIIDEQNKLRRAELDIIQAQIKPHFLYNAFDAISSLSFAGKSETVYAMVKALGTYYRNSLSNGKEVISLSKELDIVSSYIAIQNIRYRDLVDLELEIDNRYLGLPILKLILQPLVENALYHGIKPKGKHGKIKVSVTEEKQWLVIRVADNGVGMSSLQLETVLADNSNERSDVDEDEGGFGLRSTIERIHLYYERTHLVTIDSEEGTGTEITIRIPLT